MKTGLTLLCMGAGNVKVLHETFKSASIVCDEIIYGDMLLWEQDREILYNYRHEFNIKIIPFKFDYIFRNGFASLLNELAKYASNSMVMYLNTSEVIDIDYGILGAIKNNPECNTFYFTHPSENHRWYRTYNRHELEWSGRIHEQLKGEYKPYYKPIFQMRDLEKDLDDPLKAKILNDCKEILYFTQYNNLVDHPEWRGETDPGWEQFSKDNYASMKERLLNKGKRYQAFIDGDLQAYMNDVMTNPEFEKERFESNIGIEYQGDKKYLL